MKIIPQTPFKGKVILSLFCLCLSLNQLNAQFGEGTFTFENEPTIATLHIDTVGNSSNIWHIGLPNSKLDTAYSLPNCIFTDTSLYYPENDTSSFIITHLADQGYVDRHTAFLWGYYKIDSDTINDYGLIEFSPNGGDTWYNLLELGVNEGWFTDIPVLSGTTNEWTEFGIHMASTDLVEDIQMEDTILFKFTFISDSIQNNRKGWMIDNITIMDYAEGIEQNGANFFQSIVYPNPASDYLEIKFPATGYSDYHLHIYDTSGKIIFESNVKSDGSIVLGTGDIGGSGVYVYHIYDKDSGMHSSGKFQIQ